MSTRKKIGNSFCVYVCKGEREGESDRVRERKSEM